MSSSAEAMEEITITGIPASPGIAVGKAYIFDKAPPVIEAVHIDEESISHHIKLFEKAKEELKNRWQRLKADESNADSREILSAQIEIITDPELTNQVKIYIRKDQHSAQHAIDKAFTNYIDLLAKSDNKVMQDRLIDLSDIRDRLVEITGSEKPEVHYTYGDILVTKEMSPREVIQIGQQNVKGLVMENGGHTSHAAIIARSMGIPAVVGAKGVIEKIVDEQFICLNGENGIVTINPSSDTREQLESIKAVQIQSEEEKISLCKKTSETSDGHPFTIHANVEFPEEMVHVNKFCARGIGLLRTESVYLNEDKFSRADHQIPFYREILEKNDGQTATIRLFDVGGDKFQGNEVVESNPFLGWRGIRMLLDEREILREQLRAILTVSADYPGQMEILIPMVSSVQEIKEVKKEFKYCRRQLIDDGISPDPDIALGIMVEVPSTAIQAQYFAKEVDFMSIGTNDLTQYLLAVDRGNSLLSGLYSQQHPVVWKVIDHVIKSAEKEEVKVEICGELASYPVAAACLLGMGIHALSMSAVSIPDVKKILMNHTRKEMQDLAEQVLLCEDIEDVYSLFNNWNNIYLHE